MRLLLTLLCTLLLPCHHTIGQTQGAAPALHAVIVSGGMNKLMNHERYWNDCAFLYRTLRQDYHLPKRNIILLMSDGGDPGDDQLLTDGGGFTSSPNDLDGDGERDVFQAATIQNLVGVMNDLSNSLTTDDHLFIFLMDHGGSDDCWTESHLWLWNSEKLTDDLLGQLVNLFSVASVNILAGQCYSGGFIDNLASTGRIISTACKGDELSWMCPDKQYDEFIYHWTCAIAGHDETGTTVTADTNGDGHVSMAEAFAYARDHDRREETPQYCSVPDDLGERWTFSGVLPTGIAEIGCGRAESGCSVYDLGGRALEASPTMAQSLEASPTMGVKVIKDGKIMIVKPKQ